MAGERAANSRLPERRPPRRAAYILPTLFTAGNIFLGFVSILQAFQGAMLAQSGHLGSNYRFSNAAIAIGFAVFFDGLDGRIARMTNTVSDFGREMDSLADVITFGIAPAVLAFAWGVQFVTPVGDARWMGHLIKAGYFISFFYLLCGAARLARFNVQTNPMPKNPGRPDRKYFVGMPIPSAAAFIAAVVYFVDAEPLQSMLFSGLWLVLVAIVSLLMVSTWRYPSFKNIGITKPRSPLVVIVIGALIYLISNWSHEVLLTMATAYVISGIAIRLGGVLRRRFRTPPASPQPEHQVG